jgi:hypothetical protein
MREHDTYDLDAAFARLEQDVADVSSPRGAGLAVTSARRRRRTTIGAVVAVAVIAASTAGGAYVHQRTSIAPAGLPRAAAFDGAALSDATAGWTSGWAKPTKADADALDSGAEPRCLNWSSKTASADPARYGVPLFVSGEGELAFGTFGEWDTDHASVPVTDYAEVTAAIDRCAGASPAQTYAWDGAEGRSWTISSRVSADAQHVWVAREGNSIALLWTGGPAGPVPDAVDQAVMTALVAGMLSPESYQGRQGLEGSVSESSTSASEVTSASFDSITDRQLGTAFGDWPNGLTTDDHIKGMPATPCTADSLESSTGAEGNSIGGNAVQSDFDFDSPAAAADALQRVSSRWQECRSTRYSVTTVDVPGHGTVTVSTSSGPNAATNWAVQDGPYLTIVGVNGGSDPPESISAAVGTLLYDLLAHPQQVTHAGDSPTKLKEGRSPSVGSSTSPSG